MRIRAAAMGLSLGALWSCGPSVVSPELDGVSPGWGYNGQHTPVILTGKRLYPGMEASSSDAIELDESYRVWLKRDPVTELSAVDLIDYQRINGVVPPGTPPGVYGITVESPSGARATLEDAFQVTDTLADHLRLNTDQITWTVQETAVVSMQVRDLAEENFV